MNLSKSLLNRFFLVFSSISDLQHIHLIFYLSSDMEANSETLQQLVKLKNICRSLVNDYKDINSLNELNCLIQNVPGSFINKVQPIILSAFYPFLKNISEDKTW